MKSMAIAAGLAAALAVVPMAAPTASASDGEQLKHRMAVACKRVPLAIARTERLQARLAADASTRGSLAWLQAQQEKASENGHDDRAAMLASRLTFRRELAGILPDRLTWLEQARDLCAKQAADPASTSGGPTSGGPTSGSPGSSGSSS